MIDINYKTKFILRLFSWEVEILYLSISKNSKYSYAVKWLNLSLRVLLNSEISRQGQPASGSHIVTLLSLPFLSPLLRNIPYQLTLWLCGAAWLWFTCCWVSGTLEWCLIRYPIIYLLPALYYHFHLGHSQWPEDRVYYFFHGTMDLIFTLCELFNIQKNAGNYIIVH